MRERFRDGVFRPARRTIATNLRSISGKENTCNWEWSD